MNQQRSDVHISYQEASTPTTEVTIRLQREVPSPAQIQSWLALWERLLVPEGDDSAASVDGQKREGKNYDQKQ